MGRLRNAEGKMPRKDEDGKETTMLFLTNPSQRNIITRKPDFLGGEGQGKKIEEK